MSNREKKWLWEINNFDNFRMLCVYFDQITLKKTGFNSFKFETLQQIRNIFMPLFLTNRYYSSKYHCATKSL